MKRTSKRLLALILALCMALSLLSASVWAAEVSDDLTVVSSDGSET